MKIQLLTTSLFIVTSMQQQSKLKTVTYNVIVAPEIFGAECSGSLVLETKEGDIQTVTENVVKTMIFMESVKVSDCGCYSIHSARNGRGARRILSALMGRLDRRDIGFRRVKSIYRINCP